MFEGQLMPLSDDGFEKWVKEGNEPQKYLTKENVDKLAAGLRREKYMDQDRINRSRRRWCWWCLRARSGARW